MTSQFPAKRPITAKRSDRLSYATKGDRPAYPPKPARFDGRAKPLHRDELPAAPTRTGMTPGARLQAVIDLLAEIDGGRGAADDVVGGYFRRHRFAGSKDRAAISDHIYAVLRNRGSLDWWIARVGGSFAVPKNAEITEETTGARPLVETETTQPGGERLARLRLFAALLLVQDWSIEDIVEACDGDRFRPVPLHPVEQRIVDLLKGHTIHHPDMPDASRLNYPVWLDPLLREIFEYRLDAEMSALNGTAPLDLRVNALKTSRAQARAALSREEIKSEPTPFSPLGLRIWNRIPLSTLETFKSGQVEVQDEGSQLAALLAGVKPGMRVVDFCAGAGGKTLALAAGMQNRGHLVACDISERRLERAAQRLRRAGISNVERRTLTSERDKWVKRHTGSFDRVFVDAPCTGTGTWRRNPDAKWRLKPNDLEELIALQASILDSAQRLVRPGGRLIYATCSLLPQENDAQIESLLTRVPDFSLVSIQDVWKEQIGTPCPASGMMLHLTPAKHKTDGFFVAVLQRAEAVVIVDADTEESEASAAEETSQPSQTADSDETAADEALVETV